MKPSRMHRIVSLLRLVLALCALSGLASVAAAAPPVVATPELGAAPADAPVLVPGDAPFVLHPASVRIPKVPAGYEESHVGSWLVVRYPEGTRNRMAPLLEAAEAFREKVRTHMGSNVMPDGNAPVQMHVARNFEDMAKLAPEGLPPPAYAQGVAYSPLRLVLLTLIAPRSFEGVDVVETGLHELAHVAVHDATGGNHVPRWFNEGIAIHESGEKPWERRKVLWEAAATKDLLPLSELDRSFPESQEEVGLAYAQAADFVRFLLREEDRARTASLFERVRNGQSLDSALTDAYGADLRRLEYQWQKNLESSTSTGALVSIGSLAWVVGAAALVAAYVRRRRKNKLVLERWAKEEAMADARREAELAALRHAREEAERALSEANAPKAVPNWELPRVHHDGGWHTLH